MGLSRVHILHGITTKIRWDNYAVGVNAVSYLEGLPAVSLVYDSRVLVALGMYRSKTVDKGVGVERSETQEGWGRENLCLVVKNETV